MKHRWRMTVEEPLPEPAGIPLQMEGNLTMQNVDVVMLVGLPGESSVLRTTTT